MFPILLNADAEIEHSETTLKALKELPKPSLRHILSGLMLKICKLHLAQDKVARKSKISLKAWLHLTVLALRSQPRTSRLLFRI